MKQDNKEINYFRLYNGPLASSDINGNNGAFLIPVGSKRLKVIVSDGMGWEHVSVSHIANHMPTWTEMCAIKDMFWDEEEAVVQYHPRKSQYINNVNNCLHLWRPTQEILPEPPSIMVGI